MAPRTRFALFTVVTGAGLLTGALISRPAGAAPGDAPESGDNRAVAVAGNATTCAQAGLPGSTVAVGATVDATNTYLTITSVPADTTLSGVVVKGGPAYNVYAGDQRTQLHAPLVSSGKPAQISHWFACGTATQPTTTAPPTTAPPTTGSTSPTTASSAPTTVAGAESPTVTAAPGEQPGRTPPGQLAATGTPTATLLGYGSLLILIGAGLLAAPTLGRWRRSTPGLPGSEPAPPAGPQV